jgi:hypothetical protein
MRFPLHKETSSTIKREECISDRFLYVILRRRRRGIVLNVHTQTEDKSDGTKDSFYEELECVLDQFPKYHMRIS